MEDYLTKEDKLLLKEAGLSSTCIGQGLTVLRKADFASEWNYYQSFFLLTIGIERLLKIIIITKYKIDNSSLPSDSYLKKIGHDIKSLMKVVDEFDYDKDEVEFITDDIQMDIIDFLTQFSKKSRYYNIDALTNSETSTNPLVDWKKIQIKIKNRHNLEIKPLPKEILETIDSFAFIVHYDEEGKLINNASDYFKDSNIIDKLKGYSVYHIWRIIQVYADKLRFLEYNFNPTLSLREFFPYFIKGWDKEAKIAKWKDWNYLK